MGGGLKLATDPAHTPATWGSVHVYMQGTQRCSIGVRFIELLHENRAARLHLGLDFILLWQFNIRQSIAGGKKKQYAGDR